ncbi:hypothetical protein Lgra_0470 [Legionella gratiana]|uniref:Lipoprotein n=2 Tax=Legionella gratiana TaxID=45066 RepID=A0A378JBG5_9GAMM|nr:hypothetical protein Lgra_0470 [Legionella gratiana]STX44227.1 Uncharacterised protein [Legionella gratiana]
MKKLLIIFSMYTFSTSILACESGHWIKSKSSDGSVIVLEDNSVWEVDSIDTIDSALWLPIENIVVCDDELINSDNGDKVSATQLR